MSHPAYANGWAIDTAPPADLKEPDKDVSGPLRSCLSPFISALCFDPRVNGHFIPVLS